jgi:hypothetical protein
MEFLDIFLQNAAIWIPALAATLGVGGIAGGVVPKLLKAAKDLRQTEEIKDLTRKVEQAEARMEALEQVIKLQVDTMAKIQGYTDAKLQGGSADGKKQN